MLRDRFGSPLDSLASQLSSSTTEDAELLPYDILGSIAHAKMLVRQKLIPAREGRRLVGGLVNLASESKKGRFKLDPALEDVHINVEHALTKRLGKDVGERLHTGRSRNDQVATDLLLYLRSSLLDIENTTLGLVGTLLRVALSPQGKEVVEGWTHLQPAQRVYLAQLLLVHAHRFERDAERFAQISSKIRHCPLGSGALAGSSLPLDRDYVAQLLGFEGPNPNSMDAVSDRDLAVESSFALSLLANHASSLAEELVLWSNPAIGGVRLGDGFVTTSSLMPHKRNPDMAELIRAEAGPITGMLIANLMTLKALPLAYNRDLQRIKPLQFESFKRAKLILEVMDAMLSSATFGKRGAGSHAMGNPTWTVELVDLLVLAGVPFRSAHSRVARKVSEWEMTGEAPNSLTEEEIAEAFPELRGRPFTIPSPWREPDSRSTYGGSSLQEVKRDAALLGKRVEKAFISLKAKQRAWEVIVAKLLSAAI